uniref:Thyrotropin subunit beta n=1 Tax=Neogobius melanostomus TaxID=47308 RepID=A0A8C6SB56_9GOBI
MKLFIGTCLLIFLSPGSLLWAVLFSPAVPMCLPSDFTLYVEKPECDFCVAINTTICMGFCRTKVIVRSAVGPLLYQRSCTYDKVEYRTTMLPGCSANPLFTYPVALSCHCSTCRTENNDCAHRASSGHPQLPVCFGHHKQKMICRPESTSGSVGLQQV